MSFLTHCSRSISSAHKYSWRLSKISPFLLLPIIRSSLYSTSYQLNPHQISKIPRTRKLRAPSSSPSPPPLFQDVVKKQAEGCNSPLKTGEIPYPSSPSSEAKKQAQGFDWPRPGEIPYQAEDVNLVNLIGHVKLPVMLQSFEDGKYRGITFISQEFGEKSFSIPILFEGDLAHIVACHLKKNDSVHIKGHLSEDPSPFVLTKNQTNYHVVVQDINFVVGFDNRTVEQKSIKNVTRSVVEGDILPDDIGVLVRNEAMDSVSDKKFGRSTSSDASSVHMKHYDQSKRWILESDKESVMTSPKGSHNMKNGTTPPNRSRNMKNTESDSDSWRDLVKNPKQWLDFRERKSKGSLPEKFPDFKHKDIGTGLWLNRAPEWVLPGFENLEFDVDAPKYVDALKNVDAPKKNIVKRGTKDELWKSLVENPNKWWDNRLEKRNAKGPDFKHKETGEALWLSSSPDWAKPKLPPQFKQKQSVPAA